MPEPATPVTDLPEAAAGASTAVPATTELDVSGAAGDEVGRSASPPVPSRIVGPGLGTAGPTHPVVVVDARRPPAHDPARRRGVLDLAATQPISTVVWRQRAQVAGRVRSLRVRPWGDVPTLELVLVDATGGVTVVFPGRRHIPGVRTGTTMTVEGMVAAHDNRLTVLNPHYDLRPVPAG